MESLPPDLLGRLRYPPREVEPFGWKNSKFPRDSQNQKGNPEFFFGHTLTGGTLNEPKSDNFVYTCLACVLSLALRTGSNQEGVIRP